MSKDEEKQMDPQKIIQIHIWVLIDQLLEVKRILGHLIDEDYYRLYERSLFKDIAIFKKDGKKTVLTKEEFKEYFSKMIEKETRKNGTIQDH